MNAGDIKIREGFPGQRMVVLPRPVVAGWLESGPLIDLVPTDVGHYPTAQWHFVERTEGISQAVLIFCTDGEGWARVDGEEVPIRPGQALLTPPGRPHAYGADGDRPWTIYWVHLDGPKVSMLGRLLDVDGARPVLSPGRDPAMSALFERILSILASGYTGDNLASASVTAAQLVNHLFVTRHNTSPVDHALEQRVTRVIDLMQRRLADNLRVADLAREANLSPSHFSAVFKRRTGFSALDYHTRLKMQRACFQLDTTDQPVKTIAADLGFDDPLYFSRCFRRIYELSPTRYRALRKG